MFHFFSKISFWKLVITSPIQKTFLDFNNWKNWIMDEKLILLIQGLDFYMILGFGTCLSEDILSDIDMQKGSSSILYFTLSAALLKVSGLRHHHTLHCTAQNWLVLMLFKNIRWDLGTSINKGFEPTPELIIQILIS